MIQKMYVSIIAFVFIISFIPLKAQVTPLQISPLNHLNSEYNEHSPVLLPSMLIFTSNRPSAYAGKNPDYKQPFEQIYISHRRQNLFERPFHKKMHIPSNDYGIAGQSDNPEMFLVYSGKEGTGSLYLVHIDPVKNTWKIEKLKFPEPLKSSRKTSAFYRSRTNELFIVADIEGESFGGKDIFVLTKFGKNKWSAPRNLGMTINTSLDEEGVFILNDTLYFASKGHHSEGDFDIYFSVLQNYQWTTPIRLPEPINSRWDDIFFVKDKDIALISSNRYESQGGFDLFLIEFSSVETQQERAIVGKIRRVGEVIDQDTYEPLHATIFIYDRDTDVFLDSTVTEAHNDGKFEMELPKNRHYRLVYYVENYTPYEEYIDARNTTQENIISNIRLKRSSDITETKTLPTPENGSENFIYRKGKITARGTNLPLDATIYVYAMNPFEVVDSVKTYASQQGQFEMKLNNSRDYRLIVKAHSYEVYLEEIPARSLAPSYIIDKPIVLIPSPVADTRPSQQTRQDQKLSTQRPAQQTPSTTQQTQIETISHEKAFEEFIKSLPYEILYYQVQVGAYRNIRSIGEFRKKQPQFHSEDIAMEVEGDIHKFLIAQKFYSTNPDCYKLVTATHLKAIQQYKIQDAFIAAYTSDGKRIAIIWSFAEKRYKLLQ